MKKTYNIQEVSQNNFKKIDLIKDLNIKTGFSINLSKKLINDLIKIIIINLKTENLKLKNIGSFSLIKKKQRMGRNPKTGEACIISSRKSLSFTPSKKLLNLLNNSA